MEDKEDENSQKFVRGLLSPDNERFEQIKNRGYMFALEVSSENIVEVVDERYLTPESLSSLTNTTDMRFIMIKWD